MRTRSVQFSALSLAAAGVAVVLMASALLGCGDRAASDQAEHAQKASVAMSEATQTITVRSSAFEQGQAIPKKYTGEGQDVSPPLQWEGAPEGTKQFALICDDPDAPCDEPWVHWVLYGIPSSVTQLPEGLPRQPQLDSPTGALQGQNSFAKDNIGYRGPMPPRGHDAHHYHFKLYALDQTLDLQPKMNKAAPLKAMQGHVIAQGELIGTYKR